MWAFFFNTALSQTSVIKWITWHKASSKLVLFHSRWILPDLYFDGCCSCSGTINSIVINIDFPQVIIICHILDIRGLNAASQMAFWLIGTMLRGGSNTEAILIRSVAPLLYHYNPSLFPVKYTDGESGWELWLRAEMLIQTGQQSSGGVHIWDNNFESLHTTLPHVLSCLQQGWVWGCAGFPVKQFAAKIKTTH